MTGISGLVASIAVAVKPAVDGVHHGVKDFINDVKQDMRTIELHREQTKNKTEGHLTLDDIDREVANRVKAEMDKVGGTMTDLKQKAEAAVKRGDAFEGKYKGMVVDQAIIAAVTAADSGANPTALPDILNRARAVFVAGDDGAMTAMKDGQKWYADGDRTITPKEWLAHLLKEAPYLGVASTGAGGAGGKQSGKHGMSDAEFQALPPAQRIALHRAGGK